MEAIKYLKLATDTTEAGDLIKENNLTEAVVNLVNNYAEFRVTEHECKYCGAMTTQPDEECYRAPSNSGNSI